MHDIDLHAGVLERLAHVVHAVLRTAEHEHASRLLARGASGTQQRFEQLGLLALRDGAEVLLDGVGCLAHVRDLDACRVGEHGVDRALDRWRDGCGEEQRLMFGRQRLHDAADARPEAHVEHAIRLVKHERLHVRELHVVVLHEVDEAPRRCDEHVAATFELADLSIELGTTHDDDHALAGSLAYGLADAVDLRRKLAGWRDDECVGSLALAASDELQRREGEGSSLARAGLCGRHDVAAREDERNGLCLDGSGDFEPEGVDAGENLLV